MNLHENKQLFADAVIAAAQSLGINPLYVEKDYWISRSLKLLAEADKEHHAIFKGGTSLSKAHYVGARFSEDIDIAIADASAMTGNQRKTLIKRLAKAMTAGLEEVPTPGVTSKGSSYYKAIYGYERIEELHDVKLNPGFPVRVGQLMVEINSFANPYPHVLCEIDNFIGMFLRDSGNESIAEEYDMGRFFINVLDKKRTATEKVVSLFRCSLAPNYEEEIARKIRHFYDLYYLMHDEDTYAYLQSVEFIEDLKALLEHDRATFEKPDGWNRKTLRESPILNAWRKLWDVKLAQLYSSELSGLAYKAIPKSDDIFQAISELIDYINRAEIE